MALGTIREMKPAKRSKAPGARATRLAKEARRAEQDAARQARAAARALEDAAISEDLNVTVPFRRREPASVVAHLGPTNSGKTHDALEFLARRGTGVYAAPLRQLAHEAYDRLCARLGEDQVGLRTGEETINADAPVLCVTPECAPSYGDTLVLDEVHWIADSDRGWAWTRLVAAGDYDHIRLCGAVEAEPLLRAAFPAITVHLHTRLTDLIVTEPVNALTVPANWLVVAFSRKAVLAIVAELCDAGRKAGALYGALPPAARREQIRRFAAGELEVLVCTDVVGHGVNLPCSGVALAEAEKFDGSNRRPLHMWEAAQIVGRAGRGPGAPGLCAAYTTAMLDTIPEAFIGRAAAAASGTEPSGLVVGYGILRPQLTDLGDEHDDLYSLARSLHLWVKKARLHMSSHTWLRIAPVNTMVARLDVLQQAIESHSPRIKCPTDIAWAFMNVPVDAKSSALQAAAHAVAGHPEMLDDMLPVTLSRNQSILETTARAARDIRALGQALECCEKYLEAADIVEQDAADKIVALLVMPPAERYGICDGCSKACRPWFNRCTQCSAGHRNHW